MRTVRLIGQWLLVWLLAAYLIAILCSIYNCD
jgi:hypothetical protein